MASLTSADIAQFPKLLCDSRLGAAQQLSGRTPVQTLEHNWQYVISLCKLASPMCHHELPSWQCCSEPIGLCHVHVL